MNFKSVFLNLSIVILVLSFLAIISISSLSAAEVVIDNSTSEGIKGSLGNDTISLTNGTYTGSNNNNISINNGKNITIQSHNPDNKAIIDCNGSWFINNKGNLTLINLIIKNAYRSNGGAIYNDYGGNITIINCTFINNTANYGGAIYNYIGVINIYDSVFENNSANNLGGAIYNNIVPNPVSISTVIYTQRGSINIFDSILTNNKAYTGGAIYSNGYISIQNNSFINNSANNYGGAIYNNYGTFNITGSNFINNSANIGSVVYNMGYLNINYSRILNNTGIAVANISGSCLADFNWWGYNNPTADTDYSGFVLSNWFVASLTINITNAKNGSIVPFYYDFNLTNINGDRLSGDSSNLPYFVFEILGTELSGDGRFSNVYNVPISGAVDSEIIVDGLVDNQLFNIPLTIIQNDEPIDPVDPVDPIDPVDPVDPADPINHDNNGAEKTNNNPVAATAAMKETGMPIIALLLVLLSSIGLIVRKK